jgi:hypothetical protein
MSRSNQREDNRGSIVNRNLRSRAPGSATGQKTEIAISWLGSHGCKDFIEIHEQGRVCGELAVASSDQA